MKASGHAWGDAVDALPVNWDHVELRVDEICRNKEDLTATGFDVGDTIAFDALPEITEKDSSTPVIWMTRPGPPSC